MQNTLTILNDTIDSALAEYNYDPRKLAVALASQPENREDFTYHLKDLKEAFEILQGFDKTSQLSRAA